MLVKKLLIAVFVVWATFHVAIVAQKLKRQKNVYIDLGTHVALPKDVRLDLQRLGYTVILQKSFARVEKPYLLISFEVRKENQNALQKYRDTKPILILFEPPSVVPHNYEVALHEPFYKIYTWRDDLVDSKKYMKFFYHCMQPMIEPVDFACKKLCVLVNANKVSAHPSELYAERKKVIHFYQKYHPAVFDLYGYGWEREREISFVYRGSGGRVLDLLSRYKFCICYENIADQPGYITEKIFNAFAAGCVPVYWGAPNVTDYIPKDCFIDRRAFADDQAVYNFIAAMPRSVYEEYLTRISAFLASDQAQVFAKRHMVPFFIAIIQDAEQAAYGLCKS